MTLSERVLKLTYRGFDFGLIAAILGITDEQVEEAWRGVAISSPGGGLALGVPTLAGMATGFVWAASPEPAKDILLVVNATVSLDASQVSTVVAELLIDPDNPGESELPVDVLEAGGGAVAGAPEGPNGPPQFQSTLRALLPAGWSYKLDWKVRTGAGTVSLGNVLYQTLD